MMEKVDFISKYVPILETCLSYLNINLISHWAGHPQASIRTAANEYAEDTEKYAW